MCAFAVSFLEGLLGAPPLFPTVLGHTLQYLPSPRHKETDINGLICISPYVSIHMQVF